jgi:hypothetical protein
LSGVFDLTLVERRGMLRATWKATTTIVSGYFPKELDTRCHGVGQDINVQCVLIKEMIIIVDQYTLAVRNRR